MEPCPFCGTTDAPHIESWRVGDHFEYAGVCQNCGAQGPNDLGASGAMEMWNLRRPEAELRQRLAEAEAEREALAAALGAMLEIINGFSTLQLYSYQQMAIGQAQAALARREAGG